MKSQVIFRTAIFTASLVYSLASFAQRTDEHRVYFESVDGFSGYVKFTTTFSGSPTRIHAEDVVLVLTAYNTSTENLNVLLQAGYDLRGMVTSGVTPSDYGYEVIGRASVGTGYYNGSYSALQDSKLHLNKKQGGYTTPDFNENAKQYAKEWSQRNNGKSYWESTGRFENEKITTLYLSEFKNEIDRILGTHENEKIHFSQLITQATTAANQYDFPIAETLLSQASALSNQTTEMKSSLHEVEELITTKKEEKAAKEAKEAEQRDSEKGNSEDAIKKDKKDKKGETEKEKNSKEETIYIPKSNQQLYDELEAMTKATPGMLNDPKVRKRLRDYKALAGMDERNRQDRETYNMVSGGRYSPVAIDYLFSSQTTNANIAVAESAVGDVVDAATGLTNSIFAEKDRKEAARTAEYRQQQGNAEAKREAIEKWENDLLEARKVFEEKIAETIEKDGYTLVATIPDLPITYETEKYIAGETYYKGNYAHFTPPSFEKETVVMKDWSAPKTYNLYVVELNGLYGILGDQGESIFPPQFEGIYVLQDVEKRARFLVNINNKWGEILADATITEDIKYDGIWYTPDRKNKILRYGDLWGIKPLDSNQPLKEFTTSQITDLYPGGLIPVNNTLLKSYNDKSGSYSLAADGNVYVWGQTEEKGVIPISYESARRGQTVERLFKINGEWYITANYGTSSMFTVTMPSMFMVPVLRDTENGRKWGVLNQEGEVVVPFEHDYIRRTSNGFTTEKGDYNLRN